MNKKEINVLRREFEKSNCDVDKLYNIYDCLDKAIKINVMGEEELTRKIYNFLLENEYVNEEFCKLLKEAGYEISNDYRLDHIIYLKTNHIENEWCKIENVIDNIINFSKIMNKYIDNYMKLYDSVGEDTVLDEEFFKDNKYVNFKANELIMGWKFNLNDKKISISSFKKQILGFITEYKYKIVNFPNVILNMETHEDLEKSIDVLKKAIEVKSALHDRLDAEQGLYINEDNK